MRWIQNLPGLSRWLPGGANERLVALSHERAGYALAWARRQAGVAKLVESRFIAGHGPEARMKLAAWVREEGLAGADCVYLMDPEAYAFRGLDAPDVPAEEIRQAARWRVRDLVDFDVDHAAVDAFEVREHDRRLWYIFAAPRDRVRAAAELVTEVGLTLQAVQTPEVALRNLAAACAGPDQGLAAVALREDAGLVVISRAGRLYLARWVDCGLDALGDFDGKAFDQDPQGAEAYESLRLDVQRSLDFYERELLQATPQALGLVPYAGDCDALADALRSDVGLPVVLLDLELEGGLDERTFFACGGALSLAGEPEDQRIDLARSLETERRAPLGFERAALAVLAAVLFMALLGAVQFARVRADARELAALQSELAGTEAAVRVLQERVEQQNDPARLAQLVQALRSELQSKQQLFDLLTRGEMGNATGFSSQLEGLSRAASSRVWLTGFAFHQGGTSITLRGRAYRAEHVPDWVDGLVVDESFDQTRFHSMRLEQARELPGAVEFEVHNRGALP